MIDAVGAMAKRGGMTQHRDHEDESKGGCTYSCLRYTFLFDAHGGKVGYEVSIPSFDFSRCHKKIVQDLWYAARHARKIQSSASSTATLADQAVPYAHVSRHYAMKQGAIER